MHHLAGALYISTGDLVALDFHTPCETIQPKACALALCESSERIPPQVLLTFTCPALWQRGKYYLQESGSLHLCTAAAHMCVFPLRQARSRGTEYRRALLVVYCFTQAMT